MTSDQETHADDSRQGGGEEHAHDEAAEATPAKAKASTPAAGGALAGTFAKARERDHDLVAADEASKWFTYTMIGIAVYAAVVIGWIYF
ncbi:MAG: hypothetical protein U0234_17080 [Sandaracinus sp.]